MQLSSTLAPRAAGPRPPGLPHGRSLATPLLCVLALLAGCATAPPDPLAELIARHSAARGGEAAIESIRSLRTQLEIVEPGFTVTGDYRAVDGRMRIDIRADGARVYSEGLEAEGSWEQSGPGAPVLATSAKARAALAHGIEFNLFGLHQLAARGHTLRLEPDETIEGTSYRVLRVRLADGFETWLYIDPASWMIERRRDVRALHPDADPTELLIENRYLDFKPMCGVLVPAASRQVDVRTGTLLQTTRILAQDCNIAPEELALSRTAVVD